MKKIVLVAFAATLFLFSSCSETTEAELLNPQNDQSPISKTFELSDPESGAKLRMKVAEGEWSSVALEAIRIKAIKIPIKDLVEFTSDEASPTSEVETEFTSADFIVEDFHIPSQYNAINIKIAHEQQAIERGCKSPVTFQSTGACLKVEPGVWGRTIGFTGSPRNCNHTDWEWKRKKLWYYKKVYDRDSYSSSSNIGYVSYQHHDAYQLRIDPNNSCCYTPNIIDFNFVYGYSYNSNCL